ncbi:A/G-specific adenine glycosylase [Haloquadratum walsbyi]|uniref:Adenine DNA glycosylase n=1 Tax=Haloquadratum walsbyi J07HQW2 TaxID=1238425 RepID=U1PQQ9_9EURY|nr:A/G-specific adenine glycosylase [Haloquadratum walsbyi]ERG94671.1 MAG: A/G-specific DNA glycosylase [Haloquadratum walsbyi J07HQW2]
MSDGEDSNAETSGGNVGEDIDIDALRGQLISWYESDHREFPWREINDPYAILVSEVMSHQTQIDRVIEAWEDFIDRWPTVETLAADNRSAVITFWSEHALGYNNRAKYLHEAATQIVDEYDGTFPADPDELTSLMGVGPYTANAVASFAFNNGDAVVDTNVERVLYRVFKQVRQADDPPYEPIASTLLPTGKSRIWNNAIMELGGVACEKTPQCDEASCPWRQQCHAYQTGDFTAPDVPTQPSFEGSRRQFRGRIVRTLGEHGRLSIDTLGHRIRVDYVPDGTHGREWIYDIVTDLANDGLVNVETETEAGTAETAESKSASVTQNDEDEVDSSVCVSLQS